MANRSFFQFLLDQVLGYQEAKSGRLISEAFLTLPSRDEFPDYFDVIDEPISLDEIQQKIDENSYRDLGELKDDFKLMAENAMVYNKKSSLVYKDAKFIMDILDDAEDLYKVNQKLNQEARGILDSLSNTQVPESDNSGETIASFFKNLPPASEKLYYQTVTQPISLYDVEKKVDGNKYASLGEFRSDLSLLVDNAILFYGAESIQGAAAKMIKDAIKDIPEDQDGVSSSNIDPSNLPGPEVAELVWKNGQDSFRVGDFIYVLNENDPNKPLVCQIFNVYKSLVDQSFGVRVCWYFRPEQTVHKSHAKFMPNEVLKCSQFENYTESEILGRCLVLHVKDYVRGKPKNIAMEHVYVCESRYNMHGKTQTKIKQWYSCLPEVVRHIEPELDLYPAPIQVVRAPLDRSLLSSPPQQRKKRKESHSHANEDGALVEDESSSTVNIIAKKRQVADKAAAQFNFATMPKQTKDLITRLHSQRPLYVVPAPSTGKFILPTNLVQTFDSRGDGTVRWFSAPPLDVVSSSLPHSQKYLEFKKKQRAEKEKKTGPSSESAFVGLKENGNARSDVLMDVDQDDSHSSVAAIEKALLEYSKFLSKDIPLAPTTQVTK